MKDTANPDTELKVATNPPNNAQPTNVDRMSLALPVTEVANGLFTMLHSTMAYVMRTPSTDDISMPKWKPCKVDKGTDSGVR